MGACSRRCILLSVCVLQLLCTVQRQVFDFLGYLWISILVNFFEIIFVILGFFGAYQYRPKYVIFYILWHLFWLAWNAFLICLYLDVSGLDHRTNKVLKFDVGGRSWWSTEGPGCKDIVPLTDEPWHTNVEECLFSYVHVEVFQAAIQCFFATFGIIFGSCVSHLYMEEDDTSTTHKKSPTRKNAKRMSLYSIEFNASQFDQQQRASDMYWHDGHEPVPVSPKPMTPRRVKRRSVMTRSSSGRHSSSTRSGRRSSNGGRSSRRSLQNPVTRLMDQQQQQLNANSHMMNSTATASAAAYDSPSSVEQVPLPPMYSYKSVSNSNLLAAVSQRSLMTPGSGIGHANPSYQQSLEDVQDDVDELYNNRPASVRSSYSNFHGARLMGAPTTAASKPPPSSSCAAAPQVPQKRPVHAPHGTATRTSMRSMAFLRNGPPAYSQSHHHHQPSSSTLNHHGSSIDSETAM